jgi:MFS family permease
LTWTCSTSERPTLPVGKPVLMAVATADRSWTIGAVGVGVLCVSQFVDVLSVNTAVIALPDIRSDLGMSAGAAQWVISVYALLFGSLLLFAGRLADRVGHRRLFAIGLATFGAGSALCAVSQSGAMLVIARAATGAAAALTVPAALALLVSGTEEERRHRALGWWTAAGAAGTVAGLAVGGVLADVAGWRAAFAVPAAVSLGCLLLVGTLAAPSAPSEPRPLDVTGALAAVGGLALALAALSGIAAGGAGAATWAALAGAAVVLAVFVAIERRARWPLLPRAAFANRPLIAGTLASAVNTATTSPLAVLGAIYLQDVRGWSAAANGLSFVPFGLMVIAGSAVGAALVGRLGAPRTFAGALALLVAMPLASCAIGRDGGEAVLLSAWALDGLGLGCAAVVATTLGTSATADDDRGFAAGLINTATQLGTAISIALLVPLAAAVSDDTVVGLRIAFVVTAAIALGGGALVLALLRRRDA